MNLPVPAAAPLLSWRDAWKALLPGLALVALLAAFGVAHFVDDRSRAVEAQQDRNALYARVVVQAAAAAVEAGAQALAGLADQIGPAADPAAAAALMRSQALAQMLLSQPAMRSVAIVDAQGRVLASSVAAEVDQRIDLGRLGPWPRAGRDALGPLLPGRGLADLSERPQGVSSPPGLSFLPLLRRVGQDDARVLLVGVLHPDSLAGPLRSLVGEADAQAVLALHDGTLLASTLDPAPAGLEGRPPFSALLAERDQGGQRGQGLREGLQVLAYRASGARPLVAVVERAQADVHAAWLASARRRLLFAAGGLLAVAVAVVVVALSIGAQAAARRQAGRDRAEVQRRERELSVIVRSVQELLFRTDALGVISFANDHWAKIRAHGDPQIVGASFASLVQPQDEPAARALFDAEADSALRQATVTLKLGPGPGRIVDVALVALRVGDRLAGFAGSAVDVTASREAQRRLERELGFTARMIELNPLPTSVLDDEGRYVAVNRAWEAFTGRRGSDAIGRRARDQLALQEAELHDAQDRKVLASGEPVRYEAAYRRPDGRRADLVVTKVRIPARERRDGHNILVTFMDVTELHDAQRAMGEARDTAEQASRAKSEFIANVSHELRTPLQAINGFAEIGIARARGDDRQSALFVDILQAGQRMLALVDDLLDVAKIESAVGTIHLERTDLRPLVREVQQELHALAQAKRLLVEAHLPAAPLLAKADPLRMHQVLRNVLANAIRFSPPGERIVIDARVADDGGVQLSVTDRGPGIPPADLDRIFEAFVQGPAAPGQGGTGLGLAICRKIVDAHGGTIRAENMAGGGSRFHIGLPPRPGGETRPASLAG